MSNELRIGIEIAFNISYLIVIWTLVILMVQRFGSVADLNKPVARLLVWAFALLALGDTGHVGFRVIAYARGGLEANAGLIGVGALSTAITVTVFYMILVFVWRLRFQKPLGWFGWMLLAAGIIRLGIMMFPQNQWEAIVPPYDWSLLRNFFLVVQGVGVMFLILRDSTREGDDTFRLIGYMIALSYLFYAPVILWSAAVPLLGMLMIPKTCAYVAVAVIAYRAWWRKGKAPAQLGSV
ncbi:MAG: hypothetical protein WCG34_09445 [Leptolinea sp.]